MGGPTPKSIWTAQIAVDGLFKKQDMKWRGGCGESRGMNMFIIHCINSQKIIKIFFIKNTCGSVAQCQRCNYNTVPVCYKNKNIQVLLHRPGVIALERK